MDVNINFPQCLWLDWLTVVQNSSRCIEVCGEAAAADLKPVVIGGWVWRIGDCGEARILYRVRKVTTSLLLLKIEVLYNKSIDYIEYFDFSLCAAQVLSPSKSHYFAQIVLPPRLPRQKCGPTSRHQRFPAF